MIRIKRVYMGVASNDGYRVLVDRLWPRGLKRDKAALNAWPTSIAPSDALRRWFGHDPSRWAEFRECYRRELEAAEQAILIADLRNRARGGTVTLLYAARSETQNNAVVLREVMIQGLEEEQSN